MPVISGDHCCMRLIFAMLAGLKFLDRAVEDFAPMIIGEDQSVPETLVDGAFGQNGGEFAIFRTDRQLAALQTAAFIGECATPVLSTSSAFRQW